MWKEKQGHSGIFEWPRINQKKNIQPKNQKKTSHFFWNPKTDHKKKFWIDIGPREREKWNENENVHFQQTKKNDRHLWIPLVFSLMMMMMISSLNNVQSFFSLFFISNLNENKNEKNNKIHKFVCVDSKPFWIIIMKNFHYSANNDNNVDDDESQIVFWLK